METDKEVRELKKKLDKIKLEPVESPYQKLFGGWKFLKDNKGNKITAGEYLKRWGEGIKNLTPIQKLKNESRATFITLIGSITCLIALIIFRDKFVVSWFVYGLILIFVGNSWNTIVKWLSLKQQLRFFKNMDSNSINLEEVLNKSNKEDKK